MVAAGVVFFVSFAVVLYGALVEVVDRD